jgi:ABC-type sugar transport system ATPase subunit
MAAITLTDVTKYYRDVAAVNGATLSVPDGAFCVLTGPTGCGKSALLRLIAARERVTSGVIEIGQSVHQSYRDGRPELAELVDPRSFGGRRRTLFDLMREGLTSHGLARRDAQERVLRAADALDLGALLARTPAQVSTGERARAASGRAFAHQPPVLLFDEPLDGLDPVRRLALRRAIRRLQRDTKTTVVYATHDQTDALALADLLAVMSDGRVVATGSPRELYDRPPSVEAARLLGAPPMNLLPARANQTGLSLEDGTHLGGASLMTGATFLWLGVRPEHLFVAGNDGPPPAATFPIDVDQVEPTADGVLAHGSIGPHRVAARLTGTTAIRADARLTLGAARANLHVFSAETGARLDHGAS